MEEVGYDKIFSWRSYLEPDEFPRTATLDLALDGWHMSVQMCWGEGRVFEWIWRRIEWSKDVRNGQEAMFEDEDR